MKDAAKNKIVKWFWIIILSPIALILLLLIAVWLFADIPSFRDLESPDSKLATQILDEDGRLLTTFHIEKDRITLLREGTLNSQMVFQEGKKHFSLYETPYGGLMLGVKTHKARSSIGQSGGALEIRYGLEVDNEDIGENFFNIKVTEPGQALPSMNG